MMEPLLVRTVDGCDLSTVINRGISSEIVIWMHGITVNKDEHLGFFREGAQRFTDQGITSIRFDFRGHGDSSGSSLDFSVVAQNLDARAIMDLAQRQCKPGSRIHVVGSSFGAPPAIFLAARHPEAIHSVTLISPVLSYHRTFLVPETDWAKELFSDEKLRQLDDTGRLYFDSKFCIGHRLVEEMRIVCPSTVLAELRQRVLVVHGDRDSMVPYDATAQACRDLPHVNLVTLNGADHGFMEEGDEEGVSPQSVANKERIYRMIEEYLRC